MRRIIVDNTEYRSGPLGFMARITRKPEVRSKENCKYENIKYDLLDFTSNVTEQVAPLDTFSNPSTLSVTGAGGLQLCIMITFGYISKTYPRGTEHSKGFIQDNQDEKYSEF